MLTELISGLWIGSIDDIYNEDYYNDNLITIVINCTVTHGFLDLPQLKKVRVPITSELSPNQEIFFLRIHNLRENLLLSSLFFVQVFFQIFSNLLAKVF